MGGFIFYKGASQIDGSPVVGIATMGSGNRKTGSMIQTWIIRDDVHPVVASRTGADSAICGNCRHRGQYDEHGNRVAGTCTCYVMLTPVASVYRTLRAGRYDDLSARLDVAAARIAGSMLRLGSYGDPAAIPHRVWVALLSRVAGHTGYTHQWRSFPEYADIVMASVDSVAERVQANMLGFRTFRVAPATGWMKEKREILCPASEQAGKKTTCAECRACRGNVRPPRQAGTGGAVDRRPLSTSNHRHKSESDVRPC
jgi:hypothetical protein